MLNVLKQILISVYGYLRADWLILLVGILVAVGVNVYIDSRKLKKVLEKNSRISIPGAVLFGALTPLCACGTMAVLIPMFMTAMPWGAVMAFLISSPLSSPSDYVFETAFLGSRFASGVLISSIILGIFAGFIAHMLETRTGFFNGQFRMVKNDTCCSEIAAAKAAACCSSDASSRSYSGVIKKYKLDSFARQFYSIGIKKVLFYFVVFIAIGRVVELIVPKEWIMTLFSSDRAYSIPLAATIGLPLYLNDSSALPLLKSFMNAGAGEGAVLAFIIAGKATGVPVMAGMATFLKKRALLYYIGFVYVGAIVCGYLYQLIMLLPVK